MGAPVAEVVGAVVAWLVDDGMVEAVPVVSGGTVVVTEGTLVGVVGAEVP